MDVFITQAFISSEKSASTVKTYKIWIGRLCQFAECPHPLDVSDTQIREFFAVCAEDMSGASLAVIRAALRHFYLDLCAKHDSPAFWPDDDVLKAVKQLPAPKQGHHLPYDVPESQMSTFLEALPDSNAGRVIREMYATGKTFDQVLDGNLLTVAKSTAQRIAAQTAREVGIRSGFGLHGVRAAGLIRQIRNCTNDHDRTQIFKASGLSYQQFLKYRRAAGIRT